MVRTSEAAHGADDLPLASVTGWTDRRELTTRTIFAKRGSALISTSGTFRQRFGRAYVHHAELAALVGRVWIECLDDLDDADDRAFLVGVIKKAVSPFFIAIRWSLAWWLRTPFQNVPFAPASTCWAHDQTEGSLFMSQ